MYQPGDNTRGVVSIAYKIDSGWSASGRTLPPKKRLALLSLSVAMSPMTMCVSSWFISRKNRSFAVSVSNVVGSGAISRIRVFLGTEVADALP